MNRDNKLIYPELSYKIMGILFKIHNKLGSNHPEKHYQKAIEMELKNEGINYKREKLVKVVYNQENIGKYFIDFVVDNKIVLEVKTIGFFRKKYLQQVLAYLSATNLKLAIIVNFRKNKLFYKRIINPKVKLAD